jgi:hypothetical protein
MEAGAKLALGLKPFQAGVHGCLQRIARECIQQSARYGTKPLKRLSIPSSPHTPD